MSEKETVLADDYDQLASEYNVLQRQNALLTDFALSVLSCDEPELTGLWTGASRVLARLREEDV